MWPAPLFHITSPVQFFHPLYPLLRAAATAAGALLCDNQERCFCLCVCALLYMYASAECVLSQQVIGTLKLLSLEATQSVRYVHRSTAAAQQQQRYNGSGYAAVLQALASVPITVLRVWLVHSCRSGRSNHDIVTTLSSLMQQ